MIAAYVHHHGRGHLHTVSTVLGALDGDAMMLGSMPEPDSLPVRATWTMIDRDDNPSDSFDDPTASATLHWAPRGHKGFRRRMDALARAAALADLGWIDVSVEVALLWRLLGLPIVATVLPGRRDDLPHELVHRQARDLLAFWPSWVPVPPYLEPFVHKLRPVGAVSRFEGRQRPPQQSSDARRRPRIVVLMGAGGDVMDLRVWTALARAHPALEFAILGGHGGTWVNDPWETLCGADLVITHAGQGAVADVACAGVPALVLPAQRPFDEQAETAERLAEYELATVWRGPVPLQRWNRLLAGVEPLDTRARVASQREWERWQTGGAAARAAQVLRGSGPEVALCPDPRGGR